VNIAYSVLWVGITIIALINFVVKKFCSALVMGGFIVGYDLGGWLGGWVVGWVGAFKDKVTGAFKDKVTGAFRHIVIFDFLCL